MLALTLRGVLGAGFMVPAVLKWRRRSDFASSLHWLVGARSRQASVAVCLGECAVAAAIAAAPRWGSVAAIGWVGCGTVYLGALLAKTRSASCDCWRGHSDDERDAVVRALRPAWYAVRNTAYLALAVALYALSGAGKIAPWAVAAIVALPLAVLSAALMTAIASRRRTLAGDGDLVLQREFRASVRRQAAPVQLFRVRRPVER